MQLELVPHRLQVVLLRHRRHRVNKYIQQTEPTPGQHQPELLLFPQLPLVVVVAVVVKIPVKALVVVD
jgi:hypothetical protein